MLSTRKQCGLCGATDHSFPIVVSISVEYNTETTGKEKTFIDYHLMGTA